MKLHKRVCAAVLFLAQTGVHPVQISYNAQTDDISANVGNVFKRLINQNQINQQPIKNGTKPPIIFSKSDFTDIAAQKVSGIQFDCGGTARLDSFSDTRQCVGTDDGCFVSYAKDCDPDSNGADINNVGRFGMSPALCRFWFKATGGEIHGGNILGYVDLDFLSREYTSLGVPRLRYGYAKMTWPNTTILVGQYLHPLTPEIIIPNTVGFFTGLPVVLYSRTPVCMVDYHPGQFAVIGYAYSQFMDEDNGPEKSPLGNGPNGGDTVKYMQNSWDPGLYLGVEWRRPTITVGAGVDMHRLLPDMSVSPPNDPTKKYVAYNHVTCFVGQLYTAITPTDDITIRSAAVLGQNAYSLLSIGGYAVNCLNETTGQRSYTNINFASIWADVDYRRFKNLLPGMFIGFTKSFGGKHKHLYMDPLTHKPLFYGQNSDLAKVAHITPRIRGVAGNFEVGFELDYSIAWFGAMNRQGDHPYTHPETNIRALLVTMFNF